MDEIGSGRAGYQTQGEGNEHDLDGMCFLTVLPGTGSTHWGRERVIYVRKELGERVYILNLRWHYKRKHFIKTNTSGNICHSQDWSLQMEFRIPIVVTQAYSNSYSGLPFEHGVEKVNPRHKIACISLNDTTNTDDRLVC